MARLWVVLLIVCLSASLKAQEPVNRAADWVSYGTAAVNPTIAVVQAIRGPRPWCHLAQIGLAEGIGNTITLAIKQEVNSPRPCAGCDVKGMPSQHAVNSIVGSSWAFQMSWSKSWGQKAVAVAAIVATMEERVRAKRHTTKQVVMGAVLGISAELAGHLIPCGD